MEVDDEVIPIGEVFSHLPDPEISEDEFREFIRDEGFEILHVRPDGNCYFRAIAVHVYGSEDAHLQVRLDLGFYMMQNRERIAQEPLFAPINFLEDLGVVMEEGEWGDAIILPVVAECYGLGIDLFQPHSDPQFRIRQYGERTAGKPVVAISFHNGNHYNALLPIDNAQKTVQLTDVENYFNSKMPRTLEITVLLSKRKKIKEAEEKRAQERPTASSSRTGAPKRPAGNNRKSAAPPPLQPRTDPTPIVNIPVSYVPPSPPPRPAEQPSADLEDDHSLPEQEVDEDETSNVVFYEREGYETLALVGNSQGNKRVELFLLIPKTIESTEMEEALHQAELKGEKLYYFIVYIHGQTMQNRILQDEYCTMNFNIFSYTIELPWNKRSQYVYTWLGDMLLTHLISTVFKLRWRRSAENIGIEFEMLFVSHEDGMLMKQILPRWTALKSDLSCYLSSIVLEGLPVFCLNCCSSCPYYHHKWHIDLAKMSIRAPAKPSHTVVFQRYCVFSSGLSSRLDFPIWETLTAIYRDSPFSTEMEKQLALEEFVKGLDEYARNSGERTSYLLLIEEGSEDKINRYLYAGCTGHSRFASYHLYSKSSIVLQMLHAESRLYLLRSVRFKTLQEALFDEGIMIELLKRIHRACRQDRKEFPFYLLNCNSSSSKLHGKMPPDLYTEMDEFVKKGVPVFLSPNEQPVEWNGKYFSGNFPVPNPENLEKRNNSNKYRSFEDCEWLRAKVIESNINGKYNFGKDIDDETDARLFPGALECRRCGKRFVCRKNLLEHNRLDTCRKMKMKCLKCNKMIFNRNYVRHVEVCSSKCPVCGKTGFRDGATYRVHLRIHQPNPTPVVVTCPYCSYSCHKKQQVVRHIRWCKKFYLNFHCPTCDFCSQDATDVLLHLIECDYSSTEKCICTICYGLIYPAQFPKHVHKDLVHSRISKILKFNYPCPKCNVKLPSQEALEAHFVISCEVE